jgi:hypothetical protein
VRPKEHGGREGFASVGDQDVVPFVVELGLIRGEATVLRGVPFVVVDAIDAVRQEIVPGLTDRPLQEYRQAVAPSQGDINTAGSVVFVVSCPGVVTAVKHTTVNALQAGQRGRGTLTEKVVVAPPLPYLLVITAVDALPSLPALQVLNLNHQFSAAVTTTINHESSGVDRVLPRRPLGH